MTRKILAVMLTIFAYLGVLQVAYAQEDKQVICMAQNIYYESRGEPRAGKYAVGHVVMNRVKSSKFPSTPCEVIQFRARKVCAFSWVCNPNRSIKNSSAYNESLEIAKEIYYNKSKDVTNGATYFHSTSVRPSWSRIFTRTMQIGRHIFYKG